MGDATRPDLSDAECIEMSLTSPRLFAQLFERHAGAVHRYAVNRVGVSDAEDLVGETFATAFRSRGNYDLTRLDARPWLFGIATNHARHHWRSAKRRNEREAHGPDRSESLTDPDDEAVSHVFFAAHSVELERALGHLDEAYLDVLILVAGSGLSYEEVAQALDVPLGTVRSRLSRARSTLRELLGDPGQYLNGTAESSQPAVMTEDTP